MRLFIVVALILTTGALVPILRPSERGDLTVEGDPLMQVMWAALYVALLVLAIPRWRTVGHVIVRNKGLIVLLLLPLASMAWSAAPEVTLRRSAALIGTSFLGVYIGMRYDLSEQLRLLGVALATVLLGSLVAVVVWPEIAVETGESAGAWRGVFATKNVLGRIVVLAGVASAVSISTRLPSGAVAVLGMVGCIAILPFTQSLTALTTALAISLMVPVLVYSARLTGAARIGVGLALVLLGAGIAGVLFMNVEQILALSGRDLTLRGRTVLWALLVPVVKSRLWMGHGYSSFWLGRDAPGGDVWLSTGWEAPHAHNGFVDLMLDLGFLGLLMFLVLFTRAFRRALSLVRKPSESVEIWPLAYLTFMLLYNLTESSILTRNSVFWVLFVSVAVWLNRARDRAVA